MILGIKKKNGTIVFYNRWDKIVVNQHGRLTVYLSGDWQSYDISADDVKRLIDCIAGNCDDVVFVEAVL